MTVDLSPASDSTFHQVISQAVAAFRGETSDRPATDTVVNALLEAERTAKQQKLVYPFPPLLGHWRLCFATGTRKAQKRGGIVLGRGWYVPKIAQAQISFAAPASANLGEIENQAQIGSLALKFTGPCKYLGKKNLLAFDFTQIQVRVFGRNIYSGNVRGGKAETEDFAEQAIAKLPFFAFFLVTEDFIAARGRGGGLAIWVREKS